MPFVERVYVKFTLRPSAIFSLILLLSSCTQMPLKPEHGYPLDWAPPTALPKGGLKINGVYANQGIAVKPNGSIEPITLASLIPRPRLSKSLASNKSTAEDTVNLTVLPPKGWLGVTHIRADINSNGIEESYEFELGSDENVLLYLVSLESQDLYLLGLSAHQVRVFLTVDEKDSLIAKIHGEKFKQFLFYVDYSSEYIWARFERIQSGN